MIITVDIGNSRIKWAAWQSSEITSRGVVAYSKTDLPGSFDELFSGLEQATMKVSRVFVACVAGDDVLQNLQNWILKHWQIKIECLKTQKKFEDIINAYDNPEQHGVDRWAAVVAAHLEFPGSSVCVINAGTAITFDLVEKNGQHLGGYILPSYATMHTALLADTANLESALYTSFNDHVIPGNTSEAISQGLHGFIRAGVREFCRVAESAMSGPMKIIIAGGFAKTILAYPDMPEMQHRSDLVMHGLYHLMKARKR